MLAKPNTVAYCKCKFVTIAVCLFISTLSFSTHANDIEFSVNMLNLDDNENIDVSRFSKSDYIQPGKYNMAWQVNQLKIPEQNFTIYQDEKNADNTVLCIPKETIETLTLDKKTLKEIKLFHNGECLDFSSLPGSSYKVDFGNQTLYITIPKMYMEYSEENWEPSSRWDDGISGLLFDYNANISSIHDNSLSSENLSLNANGVTGVNLGPWRLRGNWQTSNGYGKKANANNSTKLTQLYAYRAIKSLQSQLLLGENYLDSNLFSSFRFIGGAIMTDQNMIPPNLRDYAPEVSGVANSNALVIISQNDRILYQTQVPPGPFTIAELPSYANGELDVRIEEQNGSIQEYQVNATSIPYLARPGSFRYKFSTGRPSNDDRHTTGSAFASGEFSWGVSNNWSLFAGSLNNRDYNAFSIGLGRNLYNFGSISFDITKSYADLKQQNSDTSKGTAYRVNYIKSWAELQSQLRMSLVKYSNDNFYSMSDFLYYDFYNSIEKKNKEQYSVSLNKQFRDARISTTLNYNYKTYWNSDKNDYRYDLILTKYVDFLNYKNISLNFSGYKGRNMNYDDKGFFFSVSIPWGDSSSLSYNLVSDDNYVSHTAGMYNRVDDKLNYRLNIGSNDSRASANTFINYDASNVKLNLAASYTESQYKSISLNAQGGMTLTAQGGAFHRTGIAGNTRILVDTDGVEGIPIKGYSIPSYSNSFGKAVLPEVRNYYRNKISIDLNKLPDNADVIDTIDLATMTEGAIGYRKFQILSGQKMMSVITLQDGSYPPFGVEVFNRKMHNIGIVGENGYTYLAGLVPSEPIILKLDDNECEIQLPDELPSADKTLLLVCTKIKQQ
ncbi:fimbria/pilus outer membrane usher protein [Providencia burhodogranariea]|uniref:Fimbrial biogenesis outer membrane usher protein n=1 Tax=Providencia burhodogranariea DSM 19968 TaxID=1141662 RepID=K8WWM3_9GAMM|nr:fimbria/pilus outer membrane usher protein [Providencia burhodogranariea]EKT65064.1 fimbrial biogenesis outer membrane usher protein [Providencia burhodogranariea DSM 19968]